MKIAYANTTDWHKDHPMGTLVFQYLLTGEDGALDNFVFLLASDESLETINEFLLDRDFTGNFV